MKRGTFDKENGQNGEVMLEAVLVLVPVLILLFALISISFLFYQKALITSVAEEISSDIAKNYKYSEIAVGADNIDLTDVQKTKLFRTTFAKGSLASAHETRAENYVDWRVELSSLGLNPERINVTCKVMCTGIGRACVEVHIEQRSDFFLSGILDLLEISDEKSMFSATSYSECSDMIGYTSTVNFAEYAGKKFNAFDSVANLYNSVRVFAEKLLG